MPAVIQKLPVDVLVDSGSDISLISESVLKYFNLNKLPTYRRMRGIGSQDIESMSFVNTILEFPEITLEVNLYVVPSNCIQAPILIGTDVLNRSGVTYIRTNDSQRLVRVDHVQAVTTAEVDMFVRSRNSVKPLQLVLRPLQSIQVAWRSNLTVTCQLVIVRINFRQTRKNEYEI